jgi:uncharacterized protein with NAD-binding domain and iron-sulfur cluster
VQDNRPIKVAIVGGGCAAVTTAFELTRPELGNRYAVTLYQLGWRLGGKGASGRGPADRIEEHGIHLWMGFYENAFRLMRECYAELGRDPAHCPIADWRDAFVPVPLVGVTDTGPDGRWRTWKGVLPLTAGAPGEPVDDGRRWSVSDYVMRSVELLLNLLRTVAMQDAPAAPPPAARADASPAGVLDGIATLLRYGSLATLAGLIQAAELLKLAAGSLSQYPESAILRLLDAIGSNARTLLDARLAEDAPVRWVWQVIDLTLATLRGEVRFGLMTDPRGFDAIDEYDCREWLRLNGAAEASIESGFVRALYDLVFAYEGGDPARPRISAAVALRCMVRSFFSYRGAFFWRMQAGMGDVVFAPFYEVLRRRGVRFEFFHRLEHIALADAAAQGPDTAPHVAALEFDVQALVGGDGEYRPLVDVHGLPCWPSQPDYTQLVDGERLAREGWDFESHWDLRKARTRILRVGEDFDLVVLAVGIGAIPHVAEEILARDARWRAMVDHVGTVATQAFQLWMRADMKELGWRDPPIVLSGFTEPFDSWGDMRHLLVRESWPHPPHALAYFCNALPDPDAPVSRADREYPARRREEVRAQIVRFLDRDIVHLWRDAARAPGEFRWDVLVDPPGAATDAAGAARFAAQFWTANVNPSDRYSLSLPGSSVYRISPLDRTYDNLTIAGDWTDTGLNAGCVEGAVMAGRLAAHAIAQSPPLRAIVGYDHP